MSYKSIFTALTDSKLAESLLDHTIALGEAHDAHVEALCLGVDRSQTGYYYAGANALILQGVLDRALEDATEIDTLAKAKLGKTGLRWACDTAMAQLVDIGRHAAARARFADLVVLPTPYGESRGPEYEALVESALFEARVPVMIVPEQRAPMTKANKIVVAWNESNEALAAVRSALPLLKQAEKVHVAVIDPPMHRADRADPGGLLSIWLARHGVQVEVNVLSQSMPRVSDVLLRHADDVEADLVVMGAYGHSRFREAILGGATRYMLEQSKLPVFMAH